MPISFGGQKSNLLVIGTFRTLSGLQRFDRSVLRGDAGKGETRRRCPRFRRRCRNDGPLSVAATGLSENPPDGGYRAGSRLGLDAVLGGCTAPIF